MFLFSKIFQITSPWDARDLIISQKQRVKKKNQFLLIFIHTQEQYLSDEKRSLSLTLASEE